MNIKIKTDNYMIKDIKKYMDKGGRILIPKRYNTKTIIIMVLSDNIQIKNNTDNTIIKGEILNIKVYENVKTKQKIHYPAKYVGNDIIILPLDANYNINIKS